MSRLNYSDDEEYAGQFGLWQANCRRSIAGKAGQAALRRLEAALLTMPDKALIRGTLSDEDEMHGRLDVCAIGALAMMEGHDEVLYIEADAEEAGEALGMPRLVAWSVVWENDMENDGYTYVNCPGPSQLGCNAYGDFYHAGYQLRIDQTPEDRYAKMLAWVQKQLR